MLATLLTQHATQGVRREAMRLMGPIYLTSSSSLPRSSEIRHVIHAKQTDRPRVSQKQMLRRESITEQPTVQTRQSHMSTHT
eukprot:5262259-Pyramimonas_sp.AAC.2